jgi:hypothetical protein
MLAKIKHDEDIFKRPLDTNSDWYKLSRTKVDYRQIIFDRMNRERPGLSDYIKSNNIFWTKAPEPSDSKTNKLATGHPNESSKYFSGYWSIDNATLGKYPKFILNREYPRDIKDFPGRFFENDAFYSARYDVYNYWWFDLCLIPETESLLVAGSTRLTLGDINAVNTEDNVGIRKYYKYSPSRDLATSVMLQFASMQKNPQAFIHKMSYITAPYMPYVESYKIWTSPLTKNVYSVGNPDDTKGITASIYGVGSLQELFNNSLKSMVDRLNRQKMFNDFFVALDNKNWIKADELSDELIKLTDSVGWGPYIGYGDLSLFIQRMNISSEYIMTHALTNFQDEVLTNAFAASQLNNKVMDAAYLIQKSLGRTDLSSAEEVIVIENELGTEYISNPVFPQIHHESVMFEMEMREAVSNHIMAGGTIEEANKIIEKIDSPRDLIDSLNNRLIIAAIDNEISNAKKI